MTESEENSKRQQVILKKQAQANEHLLQAAKTVSSQDQEPPNERVTKQLPPNERIGDTQDNSSEKLPPVN